MLHIEFAEGRQDVTQSGMLDKNWWILHGARVCSVLLEIATGWPSHYALRQITKNAPAATVDLPHDRYSVTLRLVSIKPDPL